MRNSRQILAALLIYGLLPVKMVTTMLLIHGIFEEFALIIAASAGMRLGLKFIRRSPEIDRILEETIRVAFTALLLIAIAAFLEAFVTPIFISFILG